LGIILAFGKARISSVEEDDEGWSSHMASIKKPTPKKREDGEGLLVDYALKKGRYVGTQASAQSMQVSSPTTKQGNSGDVQTRRI
jgi:hypothetical protein